MSITMSPIDIRTILEPVGLHSFMSEHWGRRPLHRSGARDRFAGLYGWDDLETFLQHHRFDPARIRCSPMADSGDLLEPRRHGALDVWGSVHDHRLSAVRWADFVSAPRASMFVRSVHEVDPRVGALAEHIEDVFDRRTWADLVVAFGSRTNPLHADYHDLFVLNVVGRKRWTLFESPTPHLLPSDHSARYRRQFVVAALALQEGREPASPHFAREVQRVKERMVWSGTLEPGDLLYVPRGMYHEVSTDEPPNLHLTFGLEPVSGVSLARWLVEERMLRDPRLCSDLPVLGSAEDRREYARRFEGALADLLRGEVVEEYLQVHHERRVRRPRIELPRGPVQPPSLHGATRLRWTPSERVVPRVEPDFDELVFYANGRRYELEGDAQNGRVLLEALRDRGSCTVDDAVGLGVSAGFEDDDVLPLLEYLLREGLLAVADEQATHAAIELATALDGGGAIAVANEPPSGGALDTSVARGHASPLSVATP